MSDDNHIYVLDLALLDNKSQLASVGCRNSVVEKGSQVIGLETREKYLTLENDDSCVSGKYVKLHSATKFEMKGYQFPPINSSSSYLKPGIYYLVQRIMTNNSRAYFYGQIKFTLTGLDTQTNEKSEIATFLFDIQQLAANRKKWSVYAIGRFAIVHPTVLELSLHSTDELSWKRGFSWDYFEILALEPIFSLKENCLHAIINHLITNKDIAQSGHQAVESKAILSCIETLSLPPRLSSQLISHTRNSPCQLQLHSNAAEMDDHDASSDDGWGFENSGSTEGPSGAAHPPIF